jgi:flagellar hook-associated protein 3 FlgL
LSTGKLINRPSDSPTGLVSALQLRSDVGRYKQWERNANDGLAFLGTIDSAVSGSMSTLQRARDLVVQALNSGALGPAQREAVALEMDTLRQQMIAVANTRFMDRPVFGGVTTGSQAYDASGAFVGDDRAQVLRSVGPSSDVRVDLLGPEVFGDPFVDDLFSTMSRISTEIRNGDPALSADLGVLDAHMERATSSLADIGARYKRLEAMRDMSTARQLDLGNQLSEIEDVDMAKSIMDLQIQQQSYQTTLGATAKVLQPSLLDFLR